METLQGQTSNTEAGPYWMVRMIFEPRKRVNGGPSLDAYQIYERGKSTGGKGTIRPHLI